MKRYQVDKDNKLLTSGVMKPKEIIEKYLIPNIEKETENYTKKHIIFNQSELQKLDRETFINKCNPFLERDKKIEIIVNMRNDKKKRTIIYTIKIL